MTPGPASSTARSTAFFAVALLVALLAAISTGCATDAHPASVASTPNHSSPSASSGSAPSTSAVSSSPPTARPPFTAAVTTLSAARRAAMIHSGSWTPRCPVALDELRLVTLTYWGFDHRAHTGRLVANADATAALVGALRRLYDARFPIRRMVPVDAYGASDERVMEADDTSVFNGRFVEGTTSWSQHSYGRAIDVDPLENPEIKDGKVYPTTAGRFVDRSLGLPGMIEPRDAVVRAFAAVDWGWGGSWHSLRDYQHFSATGT